MNSKILFYSLFILCTYAKLTKEKAGEISPGVKARSLQLSNLLQNQQYTKNQQKHIRQLIKVLQNPRKKKNFARLLKKIKKSHSIKNLSARELGMFPFIGDDIFSSSDMLSKIVDAVIGGGISYMAMNHAYNDEIETLTAQARKLGNDLEIIKGRKERVLNGVKAEFGELKDKVYDMRDSFQSSMSDLQNWIQGTARKLL